MEEEEEEEEEEEPRQCGSVRGCMPCYPAASPHPRGMMGGGGRGVARHVDSGGGGCLARVYGSGHC